MAQEAGSDTSALAATFRIALATMRAQFQQFLELLADADLSCPTNNPAWSVGEQLMHIVYWLQYTPTAVQFVRRCTSVRSRLARAIPAILFDRLNIVLTRQAARHQTRQTIAQRYDLAYQEALNNLEGISPDEWTLGAHFAVYHGEYRTLTTIFRSLVSHQAAHLDEIRHRLPV